MVMTRTITRLTALVGVLLLGLPLALEAQPASKVYRIGMLCPTQCVSSHPLWPHVIQGLRDFGWVEGLNFVFEFRHAHGQPERMPSLAKELVGMKADVLQAPSHAAAQALMDATRTIPIIFVGVVDPVQSGFVASLSRPGGNMTGLTVLAGPRWEGKRLEALRQVVPTASRIAVLSDPSNEPYTSVALRELDSASRSLNVQIRQIDVRQPDDLESAVSTVKREGASALLVLGSPLIFAHAARLGEAALKHRVPTMGSQELVTTGYLLVYEPSFAAIYRRAGYYIDKILRGTRPADLPVEQPTKFDLVINLKTAKALGLTIPPSLLLRADRIIE
jgi:putative ABC transport system substrate-binding protein